MSTLTKPIGITFILAILISFMNFTEYGAVSNFIGWIIILLFSTLFVHELGHVLFGILPFTK